MDPGDIQLVTRLTQIEGAVASHDALLKHLAERVQAIDKMITDKQAQDTSDVLQGERAQMVALRKKAAAAGVTLDG